MAMLKFTAEYARSRLSYDPMTGVMRWVSHRCSTRIGQEAKSVDVHGYIQVNIKGNVHKGHRLAWLLHYGEWPADHIDHINGVRTDNRIENLRVVPNAINAQNKRKPNCKNKSGFLGVTFEHGAWRAHVCHNKKQHHLGRFDSPELAHAAYIEAKRRIHAGCTL